MHFSDDSAWATTEPGGTIADASVVVPVSDVSQVGEARRAAVAMANRVGFDETKTGAVAILATELASNLARHAAAGQGEILLRPMSPVGGAGGGLGNELAGHTGVEILALDRGAGIDNVNSALRDGFTTSRTPGTGLGAVQRLSSEFDLMSVVGRGTAIVSRVWSNPPSAARFEIGAACVPLKGEIACGDAWCVEERSDGRAVALVADGLGHGRSAAEASQRAVAVFREHLSRTPQQIVEALHIALRPTRGAAVAVALINPIRNTVEYCGVGNITTIAVGRDGTSRSLISHNGTLGAEARRISQREEQIPADATFVMCSDGITTRWQAGDYPGILSRHVALFAGVLYRDHRRGKDDSTVLVIRPKRPGGEA